jgi:hypothetical protein
LGETRSGIFSENPKIRLDRQTLPAALICPSGNVQAADLLAIAPEKQQGRDYLSNLRGMISHWAMATLSALPGRRAF